MATLVARSPWSLPLLAVRFNERFPNASVNMIACRPLDVDNILQNDNADLAIVSFETANPNLECQVFFYDHIILIVPPDHPWTLEEAIHPEALTQEKIIIRESTSGTRRTLLSALAAHDITYDDLNITLELANAEAIVSSVAAGLGIAFVSSASAEFALEAGRVKQVNIPGFKLMRKICMLRKSTESLSRPADVFWSFIHESDNKKLINEKFEQS